MAEITKVTTPMIPRENPGKNRPLTEQAFELNNPAKVNKAAQESKIQDRDPGGQALRDLLGRSAVAPLLRDGADSVRQIFRLLTALQMGPSTSDIISVDPLRQLLESLFVPSDKLLGLLMEQNESNMLFKGEAFDMLRDIAARFQNSPHVRDAIVNLLKSYDFNVNLDNSVKTILYQCENLLGYMFSKDKAQFGEYLDGLANMLLPMQDDAAKQPGVQENTGGIPEPPQQKEAAEQQQGLPNSVSSPEEEPAAYAASRLGVEPKEAAAILKNNLLPLLGEIVVKYYQNDNIRDMVMVVVHNLVRVDKGTPEALEEAVERLSEALSRVARVSENFGQNLMEALSRSSDKAKLAGNEVIEKLSAVIYQTLQNTSSSPAAFRQAESLLMSLLQNQSSMMNVQHYILPMDTEDGHVYAEMYVDDENEEKSGKAQEKGRKVFLAVESERHGPMEMCFWETGGRVELSLWCPGLLKDPLESMRRPISDIMSVHGYTMTGFSVKELTRPQSIIQVFPKLLDRKVGIDVRI